MQSDDFKRCVEFHGHICPGLSIGYRAALAGMDRLNEERAPDEEIVAIVETDACSADAVQVLTGCTFGKGSPSGGWGGSLFGALLTHGFFFTGTGQLFPNGALLAQG